MTNDEICNWKTTLYGQCHSSNAISMVGIRLLVCEHSEFPWIHIYSQLKQLKSIQKKKERNERRKFHKTRNTKYLRKEDYENNSKMRNENFNITLGSCVYTEYRIAYHLLLFKKFVGIRCRDVGLETKWNNANGIYSKCVFLSLLSLYWLALAGASLLALCSRMHLLQFTV